MASESHCCKCGMGLVQGDCPQCGETSWVPKTKMEIMAELIEEFFEYKARVQHQLEWTGYGPAKLQKLHKKRVKESLEKCLDRFEDLTLSFSHRHRNL